MKKVSNTITFTQTIPKDYESLYDTLMEAFDQAAYGKGKERHAESKPFELQDICHDARDLGLAAPVFQIRKKAKEALRLAPDQAHREYLGAIIYAAAAALISKE